MKIVNQKTPLLPSAILFGLIASVAPVSASITVLTFEGLQDLEPVLNFYNGGLGGNGSGPGPDYGITFSATSLALIDADAGGSGNIGGEPSPDTVLFFLSGTAILNVTAGFTDGFSFYYSAINQPGVVNVYDGPDATGNLLASINLPVTPTNGAPDPTGSFSPLLPIGVSFSGTALSVDFGGAANQIVFDDITFGSETPGGGNSAIPEPSGVIALGFLMASGLVVRNRGRRHSATV